MKLYELKKYNKNIHGITLISLIITIVILIILATVVINIAVGENGIFTKAKEAKKAQVIAEAKEKIGTEILAAQIEAIERDEELEQAQIADIVSNYGELQEDGDKIILKENAYEVSLKEIYTGTVTVTSTGSYSELKAQNALLKQQLEDVTKSQSESSKELSELKEILEQTTATEEQILKDYKAYKDGKLITGTIVDKSENIIEANIITKENNNALISIPENAYYSTSSKLSVPITTIQSTIGAVYYLGTGTSYNLSNLKSEGKISESIDLSTLTSDNFIISVTNAPATGGGWGTWNSDAYRSSGYASGCSPKVSYSQSTCVATVSGISQEIKRHTLGHDWADHGYDNSGTQTFSIKVYLMI